MTHSPDSIPIKTARVRVAPLPAWLDSARLLGEGAWRLSASERSAEAELPLEAAALLSARLRGLGFDGEPLQVAVSPALSRAAVRAGRLAEARAQRDRTPGFLRSAARASGEGRFSLTPEVLAMEMAAEARGRTVLDACCGSGGNAIAFARAGCRVTAVELDEARLTEARHNARVYQVEGKIHFVLGDARAALARHRAEILFVDPPWGQDYDKRATTLAQLPLLDQLLKLPDVRALFPEIWLKLPSSFVTSDVPGAEPRAIFGTASGDRQRVKFLLLKLRGQGV